MKKSYFHEMGEYDTGMDIWGAENVEMSVRVRFIFQISFYSGFERLSIRLFVDMDVRRFGAGSALQPRRSRLSSSPTVPQHQREGHKLAQFRSNRQRLVRRIRGTIVLFNALCLASHLLSFRSTILPFVPTVEILILVTFLNGWHYVKSSTVIHLIGILIMCILSSEPRYPSRKRRKNCNISVLSVNRLLQ